MKTITFEFDGVIKEKDSTNPVEHALPALYRAIKKYDKVFLYDHRMGNDHIKEWLQHHDMEWRQCCNRILRDPQEEMSDHRMAKMVLAMSPLHESIHFAFIMPHTNDYVEYFQKDQQASIMFSQKFNREQFLNGRI